MKTLKLFLCLIIPVGLLWLNLHAKDDWPVLKGPYLGQKPPGKTPEIFAPGIISTGCSERIAAFTPDGKELYYVLWGAPFGVVLHLKEKNGRWTKPEVAPFSGQYQGDFTMSGDGNTIVFSSNSPFSGTSAPQDHYYIWIVKRTATGWGKPKPFGPRINLEESFAGCPTIANNGNLYFFSDRAGSIGKEDIWMSKYIKGLYDEPGNLGNSVNSLDFDLDPFIAPDESYLIFTRIDKDRKGDADLFISFRNTDGTWAKPINMGPSINSAYKDEYAYITTDGKYLFFNSNRPSSLNPKPIPDGPGNIYWVDAAIINELKARPLQ